MLRRPATLVLASLLTAACGSSAPSASSPPATQGASPAASQPVSPAPSPAPSSAPTADALGDRLVATVDVDLGPCAMAVDAASVWVTAATFVERIDPATNTVVDRIDVGGTPCGIAVGADGRIWAAVLGTGAVVAIDPATKKETARIGGIGPALWDLKGGFGSIWVADRKAKQLYRIDPATAKITAKIDIGPLPSGIAVMPSGVWVSDDSDWKLRRIDPATNKLADTIASGGTPSWFDDDASTHLLVSQRGLGKVVVLDPATGAPGRTFEGLNEPLDGTVFGDHAWVPEGGRRAVTVFDLEGDAQPETLVLPGAINPFVAEPGFGDVWVLDFGGRAIYRLTP